ncbi:MAG: response regulator transcription factor [Streptosporangiaceae bacterium]
MSVTLDMHSYVRELEESLQLILFGRGGTSTGAVLLVRGALADGDHPKAEQLARATQQLADGSPAESDIAAAACHVRGLVERDSAALELAAGRYSAPLGRACATEDAALVSAEQGNQVAAVTQLRHAYAQYEQLGCADGMARVRARLRAAGIRQRHWKRANRPAFGWDSLTDTERRIVELVALGLSNRQVASQVFLSAHTVAFHLRHIFWKLDVSSRVQLARLAAERGSPGRAGAADANSAHRAAAPRGHGPVAMADGRLASPGANWTSSA